MIWRSSRLIAIDAESSATIVHRVFEERLHGCLRWPVVMAGSVRRRGCGRARYDAGVPGRALDRRPLSCRDRSLQRVQHPLHFQCVGEIGVKVGAARDRVEELRQCGDEGVLCTR